MKIDAIMDAAGVIPVLEVLAVEHAAPLAGALAAGGLRVAELTLRTDCALDALAAMKDAAPDLIIGMGTIRTPDDVARALEAGADFLVSPGLSPKLTGAMAASPAPALPGVASPSEAMAAFEAGFRALKFFPAEPAGGIPALKAIRGPLPDITFCPTGGISAQRAADYLALPNVACVGGSWVAPAAMIAEGRWREIEENARRAAVLGS